MRTSRIVLRYVVCILLLAATIVLVQPSKKAAAACATQPTTYGSVTSTVTAPSAGTYRVWSRIMAPSTTANSYTLDIDSTNCGIDVGDSTSIPANTWTWVDYQSGTTTNKINVTLSAGTHTFVMTGKEANVELDRVIITGDTSCVPTGTGDNCANPPDTTPPVVSITAPANNATVSGTTTVSATASDDVAVSKVEFYVDGVLKATDTSPAYTMSLDTTALSVGQHTLYAKAYDTASTPNQATSSVVTINVAAPPDTQSPTVSVTSPTAGSTISGTSSITATAADNVGVTKVEYYVDGVLKGTDTSSPYSISLDTTTLSNASHSITAKAYDAAGNTTTSAAVAVTVNNPVTPPPDTTKPTVSIISPAAGASVKGSVTISATATDNVGVTKVEFYVDGTLKTTDTVAPYNYSLDTTTLTNASHSLTAKAYDAAGNVQTSTAVAVTVANVVYKSADINQDGSVNLQDFSLLVAKFGQTGSNLGRADINGDGTVNIQDFSLLASQFGT